MHERFGHTQMGIPIDGVAEIARRWGDEGGVRSDECVGAYGTRRVEGDDEVQDEGELGEGKGNDTSIIKSSNSNQHSLTTSSEGSTEDHPPSGTDPPLSVLASTQPSTSVGSVSHPPSADEEAGLHDASFDLQFNPEAYDEEMNADEDGDVDAEAEADADFDTDLDVDDGGDEPAFHSIDDAASIGPNETLHFGIFATRDLKPGEEVVLGWEWDDGSAVHVLPALIRNPGMFPYVFVLLVFYTVLIDANVMLTTIPLL